MGGDDHPIDMPETESRVEERVLNGDPVGLVILETIAALEGIEQDQLAFQLEDYVDADALDALVRNSTAEMQIRLRIGGYIALVTGQTVRCHQV